MATNEDLVNLLNGSYDGGKYSVVYLWHPECGTISVDSTYSAIYVSTSEYVGNVSGDVNSSISIYACTDCSSSCIQISGIGSTTDNIALCDTIGYSLLRIDISQIPVNKKIVIIDPPNTDLGPTFNYDMQLQGHLHLHGYSSDACPLSPTYNSLPTESNCISANMSNYTDYINYIPDCDFTNVAIGNSGPLVKDCKVDLLSYGTQQIEYSNSNIGEIPIKVSAVAEGGCINRYTSSGDLGPSNDTVIDAKDLPPIDIRLLVSCGGCKICPTWFNPSVGHLSKVYEYLSNYLEIYCSCINNDK